MTSRGAAARNKQWCSHCMDHGDHDTDNCPNPLLCKCGQPAWNATHMAFGCVSKRREAQ